MYLLRSSLPARTACYPRGGGGRAGLGEYPLTRASAPGPLNPSVGGGVVLGGALLTFHTTLAPRWGGEGREARVEHWTTSAHMRAGWELKVLFVFHKTSETKRSAKGRNSKRVKRFEIQVNISQHSYYKEVKSHDISLHPSIPLQLSVLFTAPCPLYDRPPSLWPSTPVQPSVHSTASVTSSALYPLYGPLPALRRKSPSTPLSPNAPRPPFTTL
jgi:hypothetical protein